MPNRILCLLLALLFSLPAAFHEARAQTNWRFVALGDMPYATRDIPAYEDLIQAINGTGARFSVHVGDTKNGSDPCGEAWNKRVMGWFQMFDNPLIYTPGDNEWTDCHRADPKLDTREELGRLRQFFFATPMSLGQKPMPLMRQSAAYPENAAWVMENIRFATLHVIGSFNNKGRDPEEYEARNAANIAWLEKTFADATVANNRAVALFLQADMWYVIDRKRGSNEGMGPTQAALERLTRQFQKPVLVVYGDSHTCLVQWAPPGFGPGNAPIPNMLRVMVPGEDTVDAITIDVTANLERPFIVKPVLGVSKTCDKPPPG